MHDADYVMYHWEFGNCIALGLFSDGDGYYRLMLNGRLVTESNFIPSQWKQVKRKFIFDKIVWIDLPN